MLIETKQGLETPGPDNYNENDKATKLTRYDNIHLGTGVKTTLKDINLTPGPGHYLRTDEQYPRTFHHAAKHNSAVSPIFSLRDKQSLASFRATEARQNESLAGEDLAEV